MYSCIISVFGAIMGCAVPDARIYNVPPPATIEDQQLSDERYSKWLALCQPKVRFDEYGVRHFVYLHKGCEFGRTE